MITAWAKTVANVKYNIGNQAVLSHLSNLCVNFDPDQVIRSKTRNAHLTSRNVRDSFNRDGLGCSPMV